MNKKIDLNTEENFALAVQNHKNNNLKLAEKFYNETLKSNPNHADAQNNLGIILNQLGQYQKAVNCYEKAIQINPGHGDAHSNLGNIFKGVGELKKAVSCYEKAIQINPNHANAYNNLGNTLNQLGEHQKAVSCYEKTIQINPNYAGTHSNLGDTFKELGEHQKAVSSYEKAIQKEPDNLTYHWLSMNTFPVIYKDLKQIDHYRKRFENSVKKINQLLDTKPQYTKKQLIDAISSSTNFYLHYQGRDDLELQKAYANLIERMIQKTHHEFHKKRKENIPLQNIKIGFVSSFMRKHTVSKLFKNWIVKLNKKYFIKYAYYIDDKFDFITDEIKKNVDHFYYSRNVDKLIKRISQDNLDVLIYLDIGMKPKIQILSSLRLASIQCNTWGHPVTSGFKNIDYYFSSELMEINNSKKNYSEKLIKLPNLGINYDFPDLSNIKRPNIIKKSNTTIFLNLQSLFKLLPQDDHIYLDIIKKNSNCCFWFLEGVKNSVTSIFKERISKLFQKEGHTVENYFYFHPRCSQDEFFGLIEESDVILDSFNWSGGNTSLEAISLNKPIVTCPSSLMRSRHTYGILKLLDVGETVANSKNEYIEISLKLATDINFRNSIVSKIKKNKNLLYNDIKPIKFLEDLIQEKLL